MGSTAQKKIYHVLSSEAGVRLLISYFVLGMTIQSFDLLAWFFYWLQVRAFAMVFSFTLLHFDL